jgi:phage terminase small subunit
MLTNKMRLYAQARLEGKNQTDAAIFAGCPPATACQAASRYEKNPKIHAHMARIQAGEHIEPIPPKVIKPKIAFVAKEDREVYQKPPAAHDDEVLTDPLKYMEGVMNDSSEDPKLRLDAAKTLASYIHAKPGEKGKKEQQEDNAKAVAGKRFAPGAPPRLVANNR